MKKKELKGFKETLLSEKTRLLKELKSEDEDGDPRDAADIASELVSFDLRMELTQNERRLLEQIEAALYKLENGTYGRCVICGDLIGKERLEALPFAVLCISCQSDTENAKDPYNRKENSFWIKTDIEDMASVLSNEEIYD